MLCVCVCVCVSVYVCVCVSVYVCVRIFVSCLSVSDVYVHVGPVADLGGGGFRGFKPPPWAAK